MTKIWVKTVSPNNLHGFRTNQLVLQNLNPGLNVVFASNAMGKSTLAKAIVNLFQPDSLDAEATVNGEVWDGGEFRSIARRRKEGKFDGFPGRTKDYFLDLQSLLQGLGEDAHIQDLLGSGFRFREPVKVGSIDHSKVVKEARDRLSELREARNRKQALLSEELRLPELKRLVTEAEDARENLRQLELYAELQDALQREIHLTSQLEEIEAAHPGIRHQNPAKAGELDQLSKALKKAENEVSALVEALSKMETGSSAPASLSSVDQVRLSNLVDEIKQLRPMVRRIEDDLGAAKNRLLQERDRLFNLGPDLSPDEFPSLTQAQFEELNRVADAADVQRATKSYAEGLKSALSEWPRDDTISPDHLEQIQHRLIQWLETEDAPQPVTWAPFAIWVASAVLAALVPWLAIRLLIIAVGYGAGFLLHRSQLGSQKSTKPSLEGISPEFLPSEPTASAVTQSLNRLAAKRTQLAAADRIKLLIQTQVVPNADWTSLAASAQLKLSDPYCLKLVSDSALKYLEDSRQVNQLSAELAQKMDNLEALRSEAQKVYRKYEFPCSPGREVEAQTEFLLWFSKSEELARANRNLQEKIEELARFLDEQGIPVEGSPMARAQAFNDRMTPTREILRLSSALSESGLKRASYLMDEERVNTLLEAVEGNLEDALQVQTRLASELEDRRARLQDLQLKIRQAEENHNITDLQADYRLALSKVEFKWETTCQAAVRYRISEAIKNRLLKEDLPTVLVTANQYLDRFSLSRYRLELAKTQDLALGAIAVIDTLEGQTRSFGALSTGTKVHVLLSLRLALIDEQEQKTSGGEVKFPLLADETMAVSDPESSRAIAAALIQISETRQVIVFTSQASDVNLFRTLEPNTCFQTLSRELPPEEPIESGLERTLMAPAAHHLDPRLPIGSHSIAAIFGPGSPNGGRRIDQTKLDRGQESAVKSLERIRRELVDRYPRLLWEEFSDQKWAQTSFAPRLREFLDECVGCPHRFLVALKENRGQSFNRNQLDAATDWLETNGYLSQIPELESISQILAKDFKDRDSLEEFIRIFSHAFIPNFRADEWYLPSGFTLEPETRLVRRVRKIAVIEDLELGLFDEIVAS